MSYKILTNLCTACGACSDICINGAISNVSEFNIIRPEWCQECGSCEAVCLKKAIVYENLGICISNLEPCELQMAVLEV